MVVKFARHPRQQKWSHSRAETGGCHSLDPKLQQQMFWLCHCISSPIFMLADQVRPKVMHQNQLTRCRYATVAKFARHSRQ